jgi:hypothetical protein
MSKNILVLLLVASATVVSAAESLFDGKSLTGWEGDKSIWRVESGAIAGGSLEGNPRNEFLATLKTYKNFILRFEYKIVGNEGFVNGGVQIRSQRLSDPANEMIGYQADIGHGYTGALYDESRRKVVLAMPDKDLVKSIEKMGEWIGYEIRANGPNIKIFVDGKLTVDYTETDPSLVQDGYIGLQIHGKSKAVIWYRNLTIETLPN